VNITRMAASRISDRVTALSWARRIRAASAVRLTPHRSTTTTAASVARNIAGRGANALAYSAR
jgi:hypothetical protein